MEFFVSLLFERNQTPIHCRHVKWKSSRFEMVNDMDHSIRIGIGASFCVRLNYT